MRERLARQRAAAQDRLSIPVGGALRQQLHGAPQSQRQRRPRGQIDARFATRAGGFQTRFEVGQARFKALFEGCEIRPW